MATCPVMVQWCKHYSPLCVRAKECTVAAEIADLRAQRDALLLLDSGRRLVQVFLENMKGLREDQRQEAQMYLSETLLKAGWF